MQYSLLSLGIPAISFGFCRSRREHTLEESLDIDTFIPGMMQMLAFMVYKGITLPPSANFTVLPLSQALAALLLS